ncbi:MAG: HAMP domain-containing histidine kinase [Actinobacteria bacterium]|nr:HAMP domain-containing histidine kinase [Actinomycetota bacterium]
MPTDAPGLRPVESHPTGTVGAGRIRGTLAGRIALVTTAVAIITALIVGAVSVPQIRAAGQTEGLLFLSRTVDAVLASVERTGRVMPQLGMGLRAGDLEIEIVRPGEALPDYLAPEHLDELQQTGRVGFVARDGANTILVQGRTTSDGSVLLFTQPESISGDQVAGDITRLMVALAVGVVFAAIAGVVLARRLAAPLRSAAAAAEEMSHGRRDVSIVPEGPREVAEVAESLNGLNAALTLSEARQREFLLSISHELRTPLTSIRGYAEALADGVVPDDRIGSTAALMVSESERLERIVSDLLDLARMGAREVAVDATPTDAVALLAEAARVWSDISAGEGVEFSSDLPDSPVTIVTDGMRLRQIVDNLLVNALRMTPKGAPIVLAAYVGDTTFDIEVRDGGPGLTDDDLEVAFEPAELYSRYRGVRRVGSGVGLALVGRLAERLGGRATAGHAPEGGASFRISLPLAAPVEPELDEG